MAAAQLLHNTTPPQHIDEFTPVCTTFIFPYRYKSNCRIPKYSQKYFAQTNPIKLRPSSHQTVVPSVHCYTYYKCQLIPKNTIFNIIGTLYQFVIINLPDIELLTVCSKDICPPTLGTNTFHVPLLGCTFSAFFIIIHI